MKKVVWLFGQSGSGRRTLVNNVIHDNKEAKKALDLDYDNIDFVMLPYKTIYAFENHVSLINRKATILSSIEEFSKSNKDVLLIFGEFVDFIKIEVSLLHEAIDNNPDLDNQIFFLNPSDMHVLHERLKAQDWYKENEKENSYRFQFAWLEVAVSYMRDSLNKYKDLGYKVYEVDTLDGYKIDKPKTLELKNNEKIDQ